MPRPRIIPVLLLSNGGLVKSVRFQKYRYIGDPINAVRIFNDLKADELVFLDIEATTQNRLISVNIVKEIGEESNMPFAVGGGISTLQHIQQIINTGAEKVVIGTAAVNNTDFIREASETFGSSTICVCIDVKKKFLKGERVYSNSGEKSSNYTPVEFAKLMQEKGAGEIIIQSIEKDGAMEGYDLNLIKTISEAVTIPVVALGGAGSVSDLKKAHNDAFASGSAAGSLFVYQGVKRGVLINYPERREIL
jgi:cyclase